MQAMKLSRRAAVASAMAGVAASAMPGPAGAQDFPSKPITIVVPFGPGTVNDIIARQLGQDMTATLGQSIVARTAPAPPATSRPTTLPRRGPTATRC